MEKIEINTPSTRSKSRVNPSLYENITRNNNSNNLNQKSDKKKNPRVSFEDVTHGVEEMTNTLKTVDISNTEAQEIIRQLQTQIEEKSAKLEEVKAKVAATLAQIEEEKAKSAKLEEEKAKVAATLAQIEEEKLKANRMAFIPLASELTPETYESELLSLKFSPNEPIIKIHRQSRLSLEAKGSRREEQVEESESDHPSETRTNSRSTIKASEFNNSCLPDEVKCDVVSWNLQDDQVMKMLLKKRKNKDYWESFTNKWTENLIRLQHAFQFYNKARFTETEINHTQHHCLLFMKCLLIEMDSISQLCINTITNYIDWKDYYISANHDIIREVDDLIKQSYEIKVTNYINNNHITKTKNQVMAENMVLSSGPESENFTRGACFDITSFSTVWLCGRTQYLEPLRTKPRSIVLRVIFSLLDFSHDEMKKLTRGAHKKIDPLPSGAKHPMKSNLSSSCPPHQNKSTRKNDNNQSRNNNDNKKASGNGRKKSYNNPNIYRIDFCQIEKQEQEEMELRNLYIKECEKNKILPLTIETLKNYRIPNSKSNIVKRRPLGEITNK